jgi:hypothetical protein
VSQSERRASLSWPCYVRPWGDGFNVGNVLTNYNPVIPEPVSG